MDRFAVGSVTGLPLAFVGMALLLFACGGEENGGDVGAGAGDAEVAVEEADPDAPGLREIAPGEYEAVVHAFNSGFQPSEIRVPAGSTVTFRVTSADDPHGFHVEATSIREDVFPGEFVEVTHTFEEPREHMFLCDVYCGGGHDFMRGSVIVE
jgi:cytochrome c oxidase subunit 2